MARAALHLMGIRHPSEATAGFAFSMAGMDIIDPEWVQQPRKPRKWVSDRTFMVLIVVSSAAYVAALVTMAGLIR